MTYSCIGRKRSRIMKDEGSGMALLLQRKYCSLMLSLTVPWEVAMSLGHFDLDI